MPARRSARTTSTRIRRPDLELLARQRARHHPQIHGVQLDALHAHQLRRVEQQILQRGIVDRLLRDLVQHLVDWLRSADVGTGMSTTARAQSLDRFSVLTICPLGMVNISPSVERSLVTRSVTSSTVPSASSVIPADAQRHQIAEAVLLLGDDEEPGQQVLHDALRAEAERGAEHRGRARPAIPPESRRCR